MNENTHFWKHNIETHFSVFNPALINFFSIVWSHSQTWFVLVSSEILNCEGKKLHAWEHHIEMPSSILILLNTISTVLYDVITTDGSGFSRCYQKSWTVTIVSEKIRFMISTMKNVIRVADPGVEIWPDPESSMKKIRSGPISLVQYDKAVLSFFI